MRVIATRLGPAGRGPALYMLIAFLGLMDPGRTYADVPARMPVQGYLTDLDGHALEGERTMGFALFPRQMGGAAIFSETQAVMVETGYFTAHLGDAEPLDPGLFADSRSLWLEVTIDGERLSRVLLGTVPYAAHAQTVAEVDWSDLRNVPAGLDDGDDTVSPGDGVDLTDGVLTLPGYQRKLTGSTCGPGQAISAIAPSGEVTCSAVGDVTAVAAGFGLRGGGSMGDLEIRADPDVLQRRITGACPEGSAIRSIDRLGTDVVCEDVASGAITSVVAGAGLAGGGAGGEATISVAANGITGAMVGEDVVGMRQMDAPYDGDGIGAGGTLVAGANYRMPATASITPTDDGVCVISVNGGFAFLDAADANLSATIYGAYRRGSGSDTRDAEEFYIAEMTGDDRVGYSFMALVPVTAGATYRFGCYTSPPAGLVGDWFYCYVSSFCLGS